MSRIIAVDVDLTVVDSLTPWMNWFKNRTGRIPENRGKVYDLVPEMRDIVHEEGMNFDPYEFWTRKDLYDDLSPIPGAVEAIAEFRAAGDRIIFVSLCDPEHTRSKVSFLDKFFEFDGFIATAHKHFVAYDAIIDDRAHHLHLGMEYRPQAKHFLFNGISRGAYIDNPVNTEIHVINHWDEAKLIIDFFVK